MDDHGRTARLLSDPAQDGAYRPHLAVVVFRGVVQLHQRIGDQHDGADVAQPFRDFFDPLARRDLFLAALDDPSRHLRSEEHTSELQSLMRLSYADFFLTTKKT